MPSPYPVFIPKPATRDPARLGEAMERFSAFMKLGDAHSVMGRLEEAVLCYGSGLRVQIQALGDSDPRVLETYRYVAEAHMQAMQLDEAEELCRKTLEIHRNNNFFDDEAFSADRRLLALVLEAKGDYESALESLILASSKTPTTEASVGIGNAYLSLGRFDEAIFSYQKALSVLNLRSSEAAPILVRLADLYHRTGMFRESKSYCEEALRIYDDDDGNKPFSPESMASGLTEIAAIYESANKPEEAMGLLKRAIGILAESRAHQGTVGGLEAQVGVMLYMAGKFSEAIVAFESAVEKLRANGDERNSAFFGIVLNQMGLAYVQVYRIGKAAGLFEEAKEILEHECGPCHLDTLGVYSNLAATYDAMGRVEDAIEILEYIVKVREEKLGTANPDVDDEKKRLSQLLKEAGRSRNKKTMSLQNLLGSERFGKKAKGMNKNKNTLSFKI